MKRYLIMKNYRNINPVIINKDNRNIYDEEKYGRYYLGSMENGDLIINIGQNGIGKSNILDAVNDFFTSNNYQYDNKPRMDAYANCLPELELIIEVDSGNKYKLNQNNTITGYDNNKNFDDEFIDYCLKYLRLKNWLYEEYLKNILNYLKDYANSYILTIIIKLYFYDYKYIQYSYNKEKNIRYIFNYMRLNHTEKELIEYIEKIYNENTDIQTINIDIDRMLTQYDIEKYKLNQDNINDIINSKVYIHNHNYIKSDELNIHKNNIKESLFLKSLFKSTGNKDIYNELINNYDRISSDTSYLTQKENEINNLLKETISTKFNELYKSNNEYIFKIRLETDYIKIYFKSKNGLTNLDNESDGFQWFFSLFFNTINPNELKKGDIIIIDEPELHLSVPLIKELRDFLKTFAKENSIHIIMSTQNPYFININYLDEVRIIKPIENSEGVKIENNFSAIYKRNPDKLQEIINSFGVNHRDITRNHKIIFVEGIIDYAYLTAFKLLKEYKEGKPVNIAFIPIGGLGKKKDMEYKQDIIDILCEIDKSPMLLIDGDNMAAEFKNLASGTSLNITKLSDIDSSFTVIENLFSDNDKKKFKSMIENKNSREASIFKNNILKLELEEETINNFFGVINKYSHIGDNQ
ncbi:Predicted ATP-binding protein involved in virulence [Brachyspira pilosicoli]|uniref:AAA family ATPase n=1 Tax=Brachyspira pilosicoli TaxID=52584 RepID=UPI000E1ADB83|nr:AAA family ATPase [Brachyspira pilosicoli]SUW07569.1 Predicted ATP-binding protein involved in virulence [Brachyspira pilosicoli]